MSLRFILGVMSLTLVYISSAEASLAGPSSKPTESVTQPGVYWVPVATDLMQYAVFEVPGVKVTMTADQTKVEYTVPRELTGTENKIEVEGPAPVQGQMLTLQGPHGTMRCPGDSISRCQVTYYGLKFDEIARDQLLKDKSSSPEEFNSRQLVAVSFQGGEPHGFLHILGSQK